MNTVIDLNQYKAQKLSESIAERILAHDQPYRALLLATMQPTLTDSDRDRIAATIPAHLVIQESDFE
jgi:hypothetical protein